MDEVDPFKMIWEFLESYAILSADVAVNSTGDEIDISITLANKPIPSETYKYKNYKLEINEQKKAVIITSSKNNKYVVPVSKLVELIETYDLVEAV